ncbi:MAG: carboxypeptidase-like regulatory domain-containing protein, partial [Bacteroidota bacterium]
MKTLITLMNAMLLVIGVSAQTATIKGTVVGADGEALIGANIVVDPTFKGTTTDVNGTFSLEVDPGIYTLIISYVGFGEKREELSLEVGQTLTRDVVLTVGTAMDEIVVSGSKKPEKLTESPATIETIFSREIEEYAGNPGELIARQKGVDYFRAGIATPAFNIRGFNSNFNAKNLQVTDGRFSTLIATGLPLGPLNTTIQEDIERIELILGPNATLYGPNAHNGLLNTIT